MSGDPVGGHRPPEAVGSPVSVDVMPDKDVAALAKGGRTNVFGFILRLIARLPFLYIAGRWYGAEALGRFAYAVLVVELAAQLATLGLKRGLAQVLAHSDRPHAHDVFDALLVALIVSALACGLLMAFPIIMFPGGDISLFDRLVPLVIFAVAGSDIALAALAYRFDVASTVRARSVIEPWTISIAAIAFAYYSTRDGLLLSYIVSMGAAFAASIIPLVRSYGIPHGWKPAPAHLWHLARTNAPLAAADAIEWGSRRLDMAILGLFATDAIVGIYYVAQQVASLPQKLKTSFDPILGPVITRNVADRNYSAVAAQVSQVGFWIIAAQAGIALALGIPAEAVMGLAGPQFVAGAAALGFMLGAEVAAATAVVSEAALIYVARVRNLIVSLGMIIAQAMLSVSFILFARSMHWPEITYAAAVALALMVALGVASLVKARLLQRLLDAPIRPWRWVVGWASAAAILLGWGATKMPEWAELTIGIPIILAGYCWIIWTRGFGPADRELFRRKPQ